MAEPLKTFFSRSLVLRLADDVARVEPGFAKQTFIRRATSGLEELELLDRARRKSAVPQVRLPRRSHHPQALPRRAPVEAQINGRTRPVGSFEVI